MHSASTSAERALAWRRAQVEAVCDVLEPWEYGRVARATRYPGYYDFNALVVERPTGMNATEWRPLPMSTWRALDIGASSSKSPRRPSVWPRISPSWAGGHIAWSACVSTVRCPRAGAVRVDEVEYDAVLDLRRSWHQEDFPGLDTAYIDDAREVSLDRGARVLAAVADGAPIGFVQLEQSGNGIEIEDVYVLPAHRGRGVGGSLTAAALRWAAAQGPRDIWIVADADGRPQHLYGRLGFVPVDWWSEFLLALS